MPHGARRAVPAPSFLLAVLLSAAAARVGWTAGFAIFEQSARGLGSAFAGEAAAGEDASTIYFNPAGLSLLHGTQLASSGFAIIPSAQFENHGSSVNPALGGGPLHGVAKDDGGELGLVPTFFLAHELGSRVHVGLGVSSPFGLRTKYVPGWVGRYHAIFSDLMTVNVNPTLAVRLTDWLSVGGGADIEYAKAKLTNAIDLGGVCTIFAGQAGIPPSVCPLFGFRPQAIDGFVKVSGDDWNAGWNTGVLFTPTDRTRVGVAYRSKIHHTLGGSATFDVPPKAKLLQSTGALRDTDARAAVDLPERVALSGIHQLTHRWALLADVTWTHWERFDRLVFRFANPAQPTIVQPEGWSDSFRYSLGVRWDPARAVSVRLGSAYDETPVPNDRLRTPRVPDSDRVWLAAGVGLRATERLRFDLGYAHIFALDASIENRDAVTGHIVRGDYSSHADIVGVQLTWNVGWPPL